VRILPSWFKQDIPDLSLMRKMRSFADFGVNTVCAEARCPNVSDCLKRGQVSFMILGKLCTRTCRFCNVTKTGKGSLNIDHSEPGRIAQKVNILGLNYVVVTSVTRDDLVDGGAGQFAKTIEEIRALNNGVKVEVLTPDFQGKLSSLELIVRSSPFVVAHNIETVKRLYRIIRPEADYLRSLELLKNVKLLAPSLLTKSSIMLGLGEAEEEVVSAMRDLRDNGCDIITLGQYLSPSKRHYPVTEFLSLEKFEEYRKIGLTMGFKNVFSGPRVRSSYYAEELSSGRLLYA
jgi:lipoic acid synthetase